MSVKRMRGDYKDAGERACRKPAFCIEKSPETVFQGILADRVGFEPTVPLLVHLISSQGRYNHFDTCPYE